MDLQRRSWLPLLKAGTSFAVDCAKRLRLLHMNWKARAFARALGILNDEQPATND